MNQAMEKFWEVATAEWRALRPKARKIGAPHILFMLDFGWFGIRAGAAYYDINADMIRPLFLDLTLGRTWRISWEFARISRYYAGLR